MADKVFNEGKLEIPYEASKKALFALIGFVEICYFTSCLLSSDFAFHLVGVAGLVITLLFVTEWLGTTMIVLEPDRIIKRRFFSCDTFIPARRAVLVTDNYTIRFFHGSSVNFRERITVRRSMISESSRERIVEYAEKHFNIALTEATGGDGNAKLEGYGSVQSLCLRRLIA